MLQHGKGNHNNDSVAVIKPTLHDNSNNNNTNETTGSIEKHRNNNKRKKKKVLPACKTRKKKRKKRTEKQERPRRGPGHNNNTRGSGGERSSSLQIMSGKGPVTGHAAAASTTNDDRPPTANTGPTKVSPSRAQNDIRKLLDALSEYVYNKSTANDNNNNPSTTAGSSSSSSSVHAGSSGHGTSRTGTVPDCVDDAVAGDATITGGYGETALPPLMAQIPKTLVGFVGTHCEVDVVAVSRAAEGILEFCSPSSSETGGGGGEATDTRRSRLLRDEFRRVLRTGGTEIVLQGIARMTTRHRRTTATVTATGSGVPGNHDFEAIFRCWGVVRAGIVSGLSTNTLVLVVRSCVLGMNELETAWNETSTTTTSTTTTTAAAQSGGSTPVGNLLFDILGRVLDVLLQAIASPRMTSDELYYDQTTILASCLALLGQACCSSDGDDDPAVEATIIGLIEDLLGVLVICARKGLIRGHDFQRLVPACQASLSRFQLATAGSGGGGGDNNNSSNNAPSVGKTIVVRVVELIELEDKTVGLWLRHTYGITTPTPGQQQEHPSAAAAGGGDPSWRSAAEAAYERAASTIGGGQRRRRREGSDDRSANTDEDDDEDNPSPPQQRELFPSIAVGPPDRMDRENYDDDDDDDEDGDY